MSPTTSSEIKPFVIDLDEDLLSDLQDRLAKTRMPVYPADGSWSAGTDPDYLKELLNFWQHSFDWRKQEIKLNQFFSFQNRDSRHRHSLHPSRPLRRIPYSMREFRCP
jgi:hypothetical protein